MTAHLRASDDRGVNTLALEEAVDMQTPTVTEISRRSYVDTQKTRHGTQVRLVRESLLRRHEAREKRA
jgi:hypothetical protein